MGDILLEADGPTRRSLKQRTRRGSRPSVPAEVKEATRRKHLFDQARVALAKKDLAAAKMKADAYGERGGGAQSRSRCASSTSWTA